MDQAVLVVPDIELGRQLYLRLASAESLRIEAALWWKDGGEWRLILATPLVHEEGRLATFQRMRATLARQGAPQQEKDLFERTRVLSPSESGVITIVDIGTYGTPPVNRLIEQEGINGLYVEGAYIYHFAPKTFIAVE